MARDAIVLACANPEPEIWPADALAAGDWARITALAAQAKGLRN